MRKGVYTIYPEATLKEAVVMLLKYEISGLIVVNKENEVIGVISEKDIYRLIYPSYRDFYETPELFINFAEMEKEIGKKDQVPVKDFMTSDVIKTIPDEYVMKVGAIMLAKQIHRLPVVDKRGRLVGVITRGSIYRNLFKKQLGLKI